MALMDEPLLGNFHLVGGTALALQIGHRKPIDLDLFGEPEFDPDYFFTALSYHIFCVTIQHQWQCAFYAFVCPKP